jgi:rubrerythrin
MRVKRDESVMTNRLVRYVFCVNESPHIRERSDGVWVRYADVQTEIERLQANLTDMTVQRDHWLEVAREKDQEIEHLQKELRRANAALVRYGVQEMRPGNADESYQQWPQLTDTEKCAAWCQAREEIERLRREASETRQRHEVQWELKNRQIDQLEQELRAASEPRGGEVAYGCINCHMVVQALPGSSRLAGWHYTDQYGWLCPKCQTMKSFEHCCADEMQKIEDASLQGTKDYGW